MMLGANLRENAKNTFKVPTVSPKTEFERVERQIKSKPKTSLEPLNVKELIKGFTRDTDKKQWVSPKDFKTIVHGNSHRLKEHNALCNSRDEPYVPFKSSELR